MERGSLSGGGGGPPPSPSPTLPAPCGPEVPPGSAQPGPPRGSPSRAGPPRRHALPLRHLGGPRRLTSTRGPEFGPTGRLTVHDPLVRSASPCRPAHLRAGRASGECAHRSPPDRRLASPFPARLPEQPGPRVRLPGPSPESGPPLKAVSALVPTQGQAQPHRTRRRQSTLGNGNRTAPGTPPAPNERAARANPTTRHSSLTPRRHDPHAARPVPPARRPCASSQTHAPLTCAPPRPAARPEHVKPGRAPVQSDRASVTRPCERRHTTPAPPDHASAATPRQRPRGAGTNRQPTQTPRHPAGDTRP